MIFCLLYLGIGYAQEHNIQYQEVVMNHTPPSICKGHKGGHKYKILRSTQPRNKPTNPLVFNMDFDEKMPPLAITAFNYATEILSSRLSSTVPINVKVVWGADNFGPNGLAYANSGNNYKLNTDFTFYPVALAEKIAGFPINGVSDPDIIVTVNRENRWFYNYETPDLIQNEESDFVSVVLHELIHGLGFISYATVRSEDRIGSLRINFEEWRYDPDGIPANFDLCKANISGENICQHIEDETIEMGNALTGNSIYLFSSRYTIENAPRLFGPTTFDGGSSLSHLHPLPFEGTKNALMLPGINTGSIIHDLGISLDILEDIGWKTTHLFHTPKTIEEDINQPLNIGVRVKSDIGYDATSVTIHYSEDNFKTLTSMKMSPLTQDHVYGFTIPAPLSPTSYQYYFSIVDSRNLTLRIPKLSPHPFYYETTYEGVMTNVHDYIKEESFQIYPNPTNLGLVMMEAEFEQRIENIEWTIHDSLGRLSLSESTNINGTSLTKTIDLSDLAKGLYFIKLNIDGIASSSRRIVLN